MYLVTEMGPEIPFEIGQFLLYKGHFLNLLHFPIWKVHTKTLLLKYDTVLADSEIAWEATDEVKKIYLIFFNLNILLSHRECFIQMFMKIIFHLNVNLKVYIIIKKLFVLLMNHIQLNLSKILLIKPQKI